MSMSLYQQTIAKTRYARWIEALSRRENWHETSDRYFDFFEGYLREKHEYTIKGREKLSRAVKNLEIMPSMRAVMTAGPALKAVQAANYNCSFLPFDSIRALSEMMYILMSGGGVGFSVERKFITVLPVVPDILESVDDIITVHDSREGWCKAYNKFVSLLFGGHIPKWDVSKVRPAGSRLKTFGGYASGPEPLTDLFKHTIKIFNQAKGRRLEPIEMFSLATYVAQIVVVGGVRRSATICLFDLDDLAMLNAKGINSNMYVCDAQGKWHPGPNAHYAMANISPVFESKPDMKTFFAFWQALMNGGSGEPGIFNRDAFRRNAATIGRANNYLNGDPIQWGANPCCEIQLRPYQMCNLTGVAIRPTDTLKDLKIKVEQATILGTWQACVSDFSYLRKIWQTNVEEERLLGVCLSGFYDHPVLSTTSDESADWLNQLRDLAWEVNKRISKEIGIPASTCVTSVKPAGNSGELYDTASGIHARFAPYYIRRIRQSKTDPMTNFLIDNGVPGEQSVQNDRDMILSFPQKSPEGVTVFRGQQSALEQLAHWLHVKKNWATHTVSCTIDIREHEWMDVGAWVYKNFDEITGLSFLPFDDNIYQQAPYEAITEEAYNTLLEAVPSSIDWGLFAHYDKTDITVTGQEFTCIGGKCEL